MKSNRTIARIVASLLVILLVAALTACGAHSRKGAVDGATMGAVAGGVGGLVSALVFGGDPLERAAQGAVYGASTGAAMGAMSGSRVDKTQEEQRGKAIENLKAKLGEDAFNGLVALAQCKHEVALANARTAAKLDNKNYALAGLWIEVLAYADSREEDKARALFPDLVTKDPKISSEAQAEETMRKALQGLMDVRAEHNKPRVCG